MQRVLRGRAQRLRKPQIIDDVRLAWRLRLLTFIYVSIKTHRALAVDGFPAVTGKRISRTLPILVPRQIFAN